MLYYLQKIVVRNLNGALAEAYGSTSLDGALVSQVVPDGPAHQAGILSGDIILDIDGQRVKNVRHLLTLIKSYNPGDTAALTVFRNRRLINLSVQMGDRPESKKQAIIGSKEQTVTSFAAAIRKFNAKPGAEYVQKPPTSVPRDDRHLFLSGVIETREGPVIICKSKEGPDGDDDAPYGAKWAFKWGLIRNYVPRINEKVQVIGKICDVKKGQLVIGSPVHFIVLEAEAIEADGRFYEP